MSMSDCVENLQQMGLGADKTAETVSRTCKFAILSSPLIITELSDFVNLFYIERRKAFLQTLYHFLINNGMYF